MNPTFLRAAGVENVLSNYSSDIDLATTLTDLLADAMHWCALNGVDFDTQLRTARMHLDHEGGDAESRFDSAVGAIHELLAANRMIGHLWCVEDVRLDRPDLSEDEAWEVLQTVEARLNSEFGVDWDFVRATADELYPRGARP